MNRKQIPQALLVALLGSIAIVGCKKNEPAVATPPPASEPASLPPAPAPMASASVTGVELGTAVDGNMMVSAPTSTFKPADTIHASVSTLSSDPAASVPTSLGVKWTHVDSNQVVHEETKQINVSGTGATDFHISKPDGWPTGRYKVDVMLDGATVQSREFEVR
jgi:hypothetical protein